VWVSEFTTKAATQQGLQQNFFPAIFISLCVVSGLELNHQLGAHSKKVLPLGNYLPGLLSKI
jgi:hypothetical protein